CAICAPPATRSATRCAGWEAPAVPVEWMTRPRAWWWGWRFRNGWPGPVGTAAELAKGSALTGVEWLAIAIADRPVGNAAARVRLAVAIDESSARAAHETSTVDEIGWEDRILKAKRVERLGAIDLKEWPLPPPA